MAVWQFRTFQVGDHSHPSKLGSGHSDYLGRGQEGAPCPGLFCPLDDLSTSFPVTNLSVTLTVCSHLRCPGSLLRPGLNGSSGSSAPTICSGVEYKTDVTQYELNPLSWEG